MWWGGGGGGGEREAGHEKEIRGGGEHGSDTHALLPGLHELDKVLTAGRAEAHGAGGRGFCERGRVVGKHGGNKELCGSVLPTHKSI